MQCPIARQRKYTCTRVQGKINPFYHHPRDKRDRNSGNFALRSRDADGMPARTDPNATRFGGALEAAQINLWVCAR